MSFEYEMYFHQNFRWPIISLVFGLTCLIIAVIQVVYKLLAHKFQKNIKYIGKEIIITLFILSIVTYTLIIYGRILLRGGMYLSEEKESDAVERIGVIEERLVNDSYVGYKYNTEYIRNGWGETVKIDGISYHIVTCGDFDVGDTVVISCLPKSKIILEINAYDGAEQ